MRNATTVLAATTLAAAVSAQGLVTQINPGSSAFPPQGINVKLLALNPDSGRDTIVFPAQSATAGVELWRSDATAAGTVQVANIAPQFLNGMVAEEKTMAVLNQTLLFAANNGTNGRELWRSDGTTAGTMMVLDLNPGGASSLPPGDDNPYAVDGLGRFWFAANNGVTGSELWLTDGTAFGTIQIADALPGAAGSNPRFFFPVGNTMYFTASTPATGAELWYSDTVNTQLVANLMPGPQGGGVLLGAGFNGTFVFRGFNGTSTRTYTTVNGSPPVQLLGPTGQPLDDPNDFTLCGTSLFFTANVAAGRRIFELDATMTVRLVGGQSPGGLVCVNRIVLFVDQGQLWITSGGTPSPIGPSGAISSRLYPAGSGGVLFAADDGIIGNELWFATPLSAPVLLADINPGANGSNPRSFARVGTKILFVADTASGSNLHAIDLVATTDCLAEPFAAGWVGTGGLTPSQSFIDGPGLLPKLGNIFLPVLRDALPNASATLMLGAPGAPVALGACNLWTPNPFVSIPKVTGPTGYADLPIVMPTSPSLAGTQFYFQWVVLDAGGTSCQITGLSASNPMHVVVN